MKTLNDFKQEALRNFDESEKSVGQVFNEAAEAYAAYQREEGIRIGVAMGKACKQDNLIKEAWNEALHWAADNAEVQLDGDSFAVKRMSILKGLKP